VGLGVKEAVGVEVRLFVEVEVAEDVEEGVEVGVWLLVEVDEGVEE
jgi:hypothetical protein